MNLVSAILFIVFTSLTIFLQTNCFQQQQLPKVNHDSLVYSKYQLLSWSINRLDKDSILPSTLRREARSDKFSSFKEDEENDDDNEDFQQKKRKEMMIVDEKLTRKRRERINTRREDQRDENIGNYSNRIGKHKRDEIRSKSTKDENTHERNED